MSIRPQFNDVFSGTIESVKSVIPCPFIIGEQNTMTNPFFLSSMGVRIAFTGDIGGQLIITGSDGTFENIGALMFGFQLSGEMLESFTGELGNMIAGNLSTFISKNGVVIDITPPTVLVGKTNLSGIQKDSYVPMMAEGIGELQILLTLNK